MRWHVEPDQLIAYARGGVADALAWSVEGHLLGCSACRRALADAVPHTPLGPVVTEVAARLAGPLPTQAAPARLARWRFTGGLAMLPAAGGVWFAAALTVMALAVGADLAVNATGSSPLLLLVAPVLPLLGVGVSYGPERDAAFEVVASTPSAGPRLVLWRTLVVLGSLLPVLSVVGAVTGLAAPARWIIPCLALYAAALALGSVIGLARASAAVAVTWFVLIAGPAVITQRIPVVLDPGWRPWWGVAMLLAAATAALRRDAFRFRPVRALIGPRNP